MNVGFDYVIGIMVFFWLTEKSKTEEEFIRLWEKIMNLALDLLGGDTEQAAAKAKNNARWM